VPTHPTHPLNPPTLSSLLGCCSLCRSSLRLSALRRFPFFVLLSAKPIGGRSDASAHAAFGLWRLRLWLFGRSLPVELAADELQLRQFRAVAAAEAQADDPRIATRPCREPGR